MNAKDQTPTVSSAKVALIRRLKLIIQADPAELVDRRTVCCRHCWGKGFARQYKQSEFNAARIKHEVKRANTLARTNQMVDIGSFLGREGDWYDKQRAPKRDCPNCGGKGEVEVFLKDTRRLSEAGLALYKGVKQGPNGPIVIMASKPNAERLLRILEGRGSVA
jgi:phage terminase small subunit